MKSRNNLIFISFSVFFFTLIFLLSILIITNTTNFSDDLASATKDFVVYDSYNQIVFENYNVDEIIHLIEVRVLYQKLKSLLLVNLLVVLFLAYLMKFNDVIKEIDVRRMIKYFIIITIFLFFILFIFYNKFFLLMHSLLFNFKWSFPSNSILIMLFPYNFWLTKSVDVFILSLIFVFCYSILLLILKEPGIIKIKEI